MDGGGGDADGCGGLSYELNVMLWFPRRSQHMTMTMTMTIILILILILINISININININIIITPGIRCHVRSCLSPESSSDRVAALQVDAATIINININIITINAGVGHAMRLHHRRQQHQ